MIHGDWSCCSRTGESESGGDHEEPQMTLENHVSRQLEPETLVEDTLVLTIEEAEKNKILSEYGTKANVYTLNEFVGSDGEIPNPYGKPLTAYGECYEILRELIKELAEKLNYIAEEE